MIRIWLLFCAALCTVLALTTSVSAAGPRTVTVDGRPFDLYEPGGSTGQPLPMIIVLHGASGNALKMAGFLPLFDFMGTHPFRVAYLNATLFTDATKTSRVWNDGMCCGDGLRPNVDDSGYVADVIKELQAEGLVDGPKVALVGHSNGSQMVYRIACEHGDLISVLIAISGAKSGANCVGVAGLRILDIHGENDNVSPINGGSTAKKPQEVRDSVAAAGQSMVDQGATFKLITVPGAGHMIPSLDQGMQANGGIGLPMTILNFIFGP